MRKNRPISANMGQADREGRARMRRSRLRSRRLVVPLAALLAVGAAFASTTAMASRSAGVIKIGIMTDCKGAFGGAYEEDIAGAQAALAQYGGAKPKNPNKPSAGMT